MSETSRDSPPRPPETHPPLGGLLRGKRALVTGVANDMSIAWAIARAFHAEGAELCFTYPGEAIGRRMRPLVETLSPRAVLECDVGKDQDIERIAAEVRAVWDRLDILVHSIGFAPRGSLEGRFTEVTTREAWNVALEISAYSLVGLTRAFSSLMRPGASVLSLTYYGSEKVVRNYNVMGVAKAALECATRYLADDLGRDGIRVNTISAGPIRTLAAAGIRGMRTMLAENAERTPLRRNIDQLDVARGALYLCSDLARNVTGEVLHVDAGQNILGVLDMST
ncbi:MAG TPA: enoyl-ACP reductase [Anaeromyxobacter sp.]|nr:enoyl-ACP reductase [Anaeromyxobacter sp.]